MKTAKVLFAVIFVFTVAVAFAADKVVYYHTDPVKKTHSYSITHRDRINMPMG